MPRGDKLEKRAKEMRMIGYASNGYRLWDPKADLILISRDVRFDENDFVYEKNIKEQNDQRISKQNDDEDDEIEQNCNKQTTNEEEQPIEQDTSDEVRREAQEAPQRPQRDRRPPPRFEDYYTAEEEMYDANIAFSLIADSDPRSYKEAVDKGEEWKKAINEEIKSLEELNTWKEAELPRGKKAIDTKWIFKTKQDGRKKARLINGGESLKYKLNDGNEIPAVALGTSLGHLADGTRLLSTNHSLARAVQWALETSYRHIDTAALYRTEDEVGLGLWNDAHERNEVIPALKKSLELLQMDYIDLYLIHYPMAYKSLVLRAVRELRGKSVKIHAIE
ncbi:hypothetical protein MSG28_004091 [Choristoneura fumiferana]|uniref:Uncharacterized protein n=1 Tax=Choristoneura fumiferana TaxID=7141 RepID=A0ACC0KHD4_CHOFU|nr:hypothetical protein MSG28_004091 [Choristoneura fumiferana]